MFNEYIDKSTDERDCHNDLNVVSKIKDAVRSAIKTAEALQDQGALAYNHDLFAAVIDALDDISAEIIMPVEAKIEEGLLYYESNKF